MRALSLHQPFASWVADGSKSIETRKWTTSWRGWILICSSQLPRHPSLPTGAALCVVKVRSVQPMTLDHVRAARCPLYEGAMAWELFDRRVLPRPIAIRGRQGLFTPAIGDELRQALEEIGVAA